MSASRRHDYAGPQRPGVFRSDDRRGTTEDGFRLEAVLITHRLSSALRRPFSASRPQALAVEPLVEIRDVFPVAVEQQRRPALAEPDQLLGRLAPARMRHLGIDVGPEAVFGRLQGFPKTLRPLVGEA